MPARGNDSKGQERRAAIVEVAVRRFAHRGLYGTSTQEIAREVGISQPYIYRLFANKSELFVAAIEHVSTILADSLSAGLAAAERGGGDVVDEFTRSYGELVSDEILLRFLMQASCALDEPDVADALRSCWARQVETLTRPGTLSDDQVRQVLARSLLANVVIGLRLDELDRPWAKVMSGR